MPGGITMTRTSACSGTGKAAIITAACDPYSEPCRNVRRRQAIEGRYMSRLPNCEVGELGLKSGTVDPSEPLLTV